MSNVAVLPPLHPNRTKNSKHEVNVAASVSIPKPQLLTAKSPRRPPKNRSTTEFDKPEYLVQQYNQLQHDISSLKKVVGPLQQESDDLQVRCERMSYTPEMRELAAQADHEDQTKKQLDDDLATIRRTFTPEIHKKLINEVSDLKGRFHYHSEKLEEVEEEIDTKSTSLDGILQSDNVTEMDEYQQNLVTLRKRLKELANENEDLESDLELKLNDLAADPVEDKNIAVMKRRLRQEQRKTSERRNQLNLMRKEFENKRNDLNEKIEKKQKEKKAKITARNWRQNLKIPEPVNDDEDDDNNLNSDNFDNSFTENTEENATQYSSSSYEYDDNLSEAADQESNSKSDDTNHHDDDIIKIDKSDENDENNNDNFDNYEENDDKDREANVLDNTLKEISGRLKSESGEFRYILPLTDNPEIKFEHFVQLDVEPSLDFDYTTTYSSECIMSKSTPANSALNLIQQPSSLLINENNKALTVGGIKSRQSNDSNDANNTNNSKTDETSDEQIQHQEAVKYVQEICTEEALSDEETEYTLSEEENIKQNEEEYQDEARLDEEVELEYKEDEKIKDKESESTELSEMEMNRAVSDEERDKENELQEGLLGNQLGNLIQQLENNESENDKEKENENESESKSESENENKKENDESESESSGKTKKLSFSRAQKSQIVADIQPCSLYLELAHNVEKYGDDINFDDLL